MRSATVCSTPRQTLRPGSGLCLALGVAMLSVASPSFGCELLLENAHVPLAPPGASTWVGYGVLRNPGSTSVTIRALGSPQFANVELHENVRDGDIVRMRRIDPIEVPSGGSIALERSGRHLMLERPTHALTAGDQVELTVDACERRFTFPLSVKAEDAGNGHEYHNHH